MKNNALQFFTVSVFSFLLLLFAGCEHINTDAYMFESTTSIVSSGLKSVKLVVSSNASLLSVRKSRTIVPSAYNADELNFYLGGKNIGTGANLAVQQVQFVASADATSSGTIVVPLKSYNYSLVLLAIPKTTTISLSSDTYVASIVSFAVLAGSTTADLRYNNDSSVNFYLSSEGLSGNGSYDIDFYLKDWSTASLSAGDPNNSDIAVVNNVKIALYDIVGGDAVDGTEVEGLGFASYLSDSSAYSYTNSTVPPGTYDLCVTFSFNGKYFIYSDKIVILPYQTTSALIAIPDILQVVPAAPSELKQGYILPASDESNYYRAAFSWTDNSNTETGFELQLLDVSDLSSITVDSANTESTWNSVSTSQITSYSTDFEGSSAWYALSFSRNSTGAVFYLPLGKRYLARIRSVNNDVGGSSWAYASSDSFSLTIPTGESTATTAILTDSETLSVSAFNTSLVNLFRITYSLAGGTFSKSMTNSYYFDQILGGVPVLVPDGESTTANSVYPQPVSLFLGERAWSYWAISSLDGEEYPGSYIQCTSSSVYNASTTYYNQKRRTDLGLSTTDVNGNIYTYKVATPDSSTFSTDYSSYWISAGWLANYTGCKNLSLYAVYEDDESGRAATDYSIKTNLDFTVLADGNACTITNYVFEAPSGTGTFNIIYDYKTTAFTYDSVLLTLTENGGGEIGTYSPNSRTFTFSPSLDDGVYTLTISAMKSGAEFRTSLIMILN